MTDTEAEFARKDREYFDLIGRTAVHSEWAARIIEYRPASGPRYIFRLQYEAGPHRGEEVEVQRKDFYVLPTGDQIADALNRVRDTEGQFIIPGRLLYEGAHRLLTDAVLALLTGSVK